MTLGPNARRPELVVLDTQYDELMAMVPAPPPVAPAVPPRLQPLAMVKNEVAVAHGAMSHPDTPVAQGTAVGAAAAAPAAPTIEDGVSQTTNHEFAMKDLRDYATCLESGPSTTWGYPEAAVDSHDAPSWPLLSNESQKRERTDDCQSSPAATERAKRKRVEDTHKAVRRAAVVEAFLREPGNPRPAVEPEKFRTGSVRQRVATRQLRILRELRASTLAGGKSLPEDLVCQELPEDAVTKSANQTTSSQKAPDISTTGSLAGDSCLADSASGLQAAGGLELNDCSLQEEESLRRNTFKTTLSDSTKAEAQTKQELATVDETDGDVRSVAPPNASMEAVLPADEIHPSQVADTQSSFDEQRCAAYGAQQTAATESLDKMETVPFETPKRLARVLYDWVGGIEGDLTLTRGAVLTITNEVPGFGWWSGTVDGEVEELDGDAETETHIHIFEQEIVKEEEAFMAAIGIKKPPVPKPRVPSRPPKSRPAQPYEVNESVLANWNGQLTLAKVLQAKFDMSTAPDEWSFRLHFEGWLSKHDAWFSVRYLMPYKLEEDKIEDAGTTDAARTSKQATNHKNETAAAGRTAEPVGKTEAVTLTGASDTTAEATAVEHQNKIPDKASVPGEQSADSIGTCQAASAPDQSDEAKDSNAAAEDDWDAAMAAEEEGNQWLYSCIMCGDGGDVVMCEACPRVYHIDCLGQSRVGRGGWHCPVCVKASRSVTRRKQRPRIQASAVQTQLEDIEKLCLKLPAGHFMAAMGTELRSARQTYSKCEDQGVEIADEDLPRIRDVSAWQRFLRAKLDEQEELELSRRSRSRVVMKIFSPDQDRNSVVAQFHEQGITQLRQVLTSEQVNEAVGAVETRFNHVIKVVNTMSLQHILESVGFTTFKLRHVGRYDMVIPEFDTAKFAFLNAHATWMPTVKAILGDDCDCIYKGVMLSLPGSFPQPWHQDGPHLSEKKHLNAHCLNVFVPLVDLTTKNGPTEFVPTTQVLGRFDAPENPVAVCASAGDVVLMDYRIKHRGLGNNSAEPRPLLYITYAKKGWTDRANFSSRRYRALPELDDADRFQPQAKRKFQPDGAAGNSGDLPGWSVVVELQAGELRATWQSPSPVLEVKIGLGVKHQGGQGGGSFDTKRKKGPLSRGEFCWPIAQIEKRYVGKGPLIIAVWDESFPERPSVWSNPFMLNADDGGELQLTLA